MRFNNDRPIFLQIADWLEDEILAGRFGSGDRLPSARDLAVSMEVNPNTTSRTLQLMAERKVAGMERGSGYFVLPEAGRMIVQARRKRLMTETLPDLFQTMQMLGISAEELLEYYQDFLEGRPHESQ